MQNLENLLWSLTVEEVKIVKRKLGLPKLNGNKGELIKGIMNFYQTPNWLEDYFSTLKGFEKEYATLLIQENFNPIRYEVDELLDKYNIKRDWRGKFDDNLKFVINGHVPSAFKPTLLKLVPPIEISFDSTFDLALADESILLNNSKNPMQKFDNFLIFINKNKIKATEKNNYMPKSSILKFIQEYKVDEIVRNEDYDIESLKNQNNTVIVNGIINLLINSKVIDVKNGYFGLGPNYSKFIKLHPILKAKFLLNDYLNSSYKSINEIDRLTNYAYKYSTPLNLARVREPVMDLILKLPINKWVDTSQIVYFIRIKNMNFLRNNIGEILVKDDYDNWYYTPSFEDLETSFIETMLMDFLGVLGIFDVVVNGCYNDRYTRYYLNASYVRLTEFGASVLGLKNTTVATKEDKPLIVTSNFEVIIEECMKRMEYELYFDRFLDKVSQDEEKSIYKLDFMGIAKAYDLQENIMDYIISECPSVPEAVCSKFNDWLQTLDKITIKTVTILEAPKSILDELRQISKVKNSIEKNNLEHIVISSKKSREVKKAIEEKEYFCKIKL